MKLQEGCLRNELLDTQEQGGQLRRYARIFVGTRLKKAVKRKVGDILHERMTIPWKNKEKSIGYVIKYIIVKELINNAFDSVEERQQTIYATLDGKKIRIKFYFNEENNCLTITVRDNGLGSNASDTYMKTTGIIKRQIGGFGVGEQYIQRLGFVDKYERVIGENGAIIKVRINLDKISEENGGARKRDRFKK